MLSQEDVIRHNTNQQNIREAIKALTPMATVEDGKNDDLKKKASEYIDKLIDKIEPALPERAVQTIR